MPDLLQAHMLCGCTGTTDARLGGSLDLAIAISRLTPGPTLDLGRQVQTLLADHNLPILMARHWAGRWDSAAISSLKPVIARCTSKHIKAVLGCIGRITSSTTSACWRHFIAMSRELAPPTARPPSPVPPVAWPMSTLE